MKVIYLVGFMGAGKTTIGKLLSKKLNVSVLDTDVVIEKKQRRSIKEIFQVEGEKYFRTLETMTLKELPCTDCIITTGGGIVTNDENIKYMKDTGVVIYLQTSFEVIVERLIGNEDRPLFQHDYLENTRNLYESRLSSYNQAHLIIPTDYKSVSEIVGNIITGIKELK